VSNGYWDFSKWGRPIRKIAAAAISAIIVAPVFIGWLNSENDLDWKQLLAVIVAAVTPVIVGYLVPGEQLPPGGEPLD
jgi:branched-subunit amino acid transport protein